MDYYEVKQNMILVNGINQWMVIYSNTNLRLVMEFVERIIKGGKVEKRDIGITHTVITSIDF
jgi:hypothetical protein